jgi:hypothetical protein
MADARVTDQDYINDAKAAVATLPADELICSHHDTWDAELQPTGKACGIPAKFLVVWPESRQYSLACEPHATDVSPHAPEHILSRLVDTP